MLVCRRHCARVKCRVGVGSEERERWRDVYFANDILQLLYNIIKIIAVRVKLMKCSLLVWQGDPY